MIKRSVTLHFRWNGRSFSGFEGDTVASALAASGQQVFSRSLKYHRPRGILTADYWDPNLMVQVGDDPNVRAGHRLLEEGMDVRAQNVWPSLRFDLKAANSLVGRFLSAGFYYKTFMRPRWLWPSYERVLSAFGPGGRVDIDSPDRYHDKRYTHPDVVVAGAGPAGIEAALAASKAGARVLLVEHEHSVGGHLRYSTRAAEQVALGKLRGTLEASDVEVLTDSTVTGRYEDNWLGIVQRNHPIAVERLIKARAKMLVVAPGLIERPYVFEGNDRPGVITSAAARRLINLWGVKPGERAVVFSANDEGDAAADLRDAGVDVAAVIDGRKGHRINSTRGSRRAVEGVVADGVRIDADLLVVAAGWTAPTSLLNMAGDRPAYDRYAARFFPSNPPDSVLATGGLSGDGTLDELRTHGAATGRLAAARALSVAHRIQARTARARAVGGPEPDWAADDRLPLRRDFHPELFRSDTHGMIDFSEDVGSKDLLAAAREGYDSVELAKRYTTATMGSSQGKLETVNTVAVLAEARGENIGEVGTTVWRPPYAPVSLGALAGRVFEPVRVSPIQPWHEANGVRTILAGQWVRPDHYGDPAAEVRNARSNVGIIDVTPLGKLDLRGPDIPKLLNLLYTNKWSNLAVGKVRYGMMCGEDGVVLDDGVTGRLGEDHYMMTTTSSGAGVVWEWVENWLQTERPDWRVHVTPVTSAYASINVAGPKSRRLVGRVVRDVDLSPEGFAYMEVRSATVAGVAGCFMWRIGFTGDLSYELHVPAGHGMHVWEALIEAGADLGVGPFGMEGQRIMRLEKGHFIVGQDTDGLTMAPSTGLSRLIRLDKENFVGRPELGWSGSRRLPMIVAIQPDHPQTVPDEGCQIVRGDTNEILGRITSSRMSPTLRRSICLGQVEPELAIGGSRVTVLLASGDRIGATVMGHHAHFDPAGERLRG
ncbi:MAG: 2Fe-2S iron-sulfur cluster-binding protein [bacterium]|nr:2Fe-2S iron-sulfur cluster-binding protein [bacterium]